MTISTIAEAADDVLATPGFALPDLRASYDSYISSGLYDRRYPRPNPTTLRRLLAHLPADGRFLDIGAGTGRYTLPLLERTRAAGVAQDICPSACRALSERLARFVDEGRLAVRSEDVATLAAGRAGGFDLAILAFGVLGHVAGRAARLRLLDAVRRLLVPGGSLVLSLPNARRRFAAEQRASAAMVRAGVLEPGDILYTRGEGARMIEMYYHLYTLAEARRDLGDAGYRIESVGPESLVAEETASRRPLVGRLDAAACLFAPASWGYGFLIVAKPDADRNG